MTRSGLGVTHVSVSFLQRSYAEDDQEIKPKLPF